MVAFIGEGNQEKAAKELLARLSVVDSADFRRYWGDAVDESITLPSRPEDNDFVVRLKNGTKMLVGVRSYGVLHRVDYMAMDSTSSGLAPLVSLANWQNIEAKAARHCVVVRGSADGPKNTSYVVEGFYCGAYGNRRYSTFMAVFFTDISRLAEDKTARELIA